MTTPTARVTFPSAHGGARAADSTAAGGAGSHTTGAMTRQADEMTPATAGGCAHPDDTTAHSAWMTAPREAMTAPRAAMTRKICDATSATARVVAPCADETAPLPETIPHRAEGSDTSGDSTAAAACLTATIRRPASRPSRHRPAHTERTSPSKVPAPNGTFSPVLSGYSSAGRHQCAT